jgi:glycogen debranching enzyme
MTNRLQLRARGNQHYIYSGRSILVTNLDGWISGAGTEGFYADNTRILSRDEILVDGLSLRPASVSPVGSDAFLAYYEARATPGVPERTLYATVRRRVDEGLRTEIELTNYDRDRELTFEIALPLAADFADSDEAESGHRRQCASVATDWDEAARTLTFRYRHPGLDRSALLRVETPGLPLVFENDSLCARLVLPARQSAALHLVLLPRFDGVTGEAPGRVFPAHPLPMTSLRSRLTDTMPRLESSNHTVVPAWETATSDLASFPLGLPGAPATPVAGLPLYQQFFGRDCLTISWQALMAAPRLMRDSLLANARWQGTRLDDRRDEEPGKMIHQARWGPLSALGLDAFDRYYGDWATPVDFIAMLGQYLCWTDDRSVLPELLPAASRVLEWIERYGDPDHDGFLEYQTHSPQGVKHQGWKDSDDAIVTASGEELDPPLAACEIQAYWYAGLQQVALAFWLGGDRARALPLLREATRLKERFNRTFWMEDQAFYATAIGPGGRLADSISSNPGHLLVTGIVPRDRARTVARRLLAPDMFSGWGVRTLSSDNPFYNPFSYHRGSVWPVEQGTIALGLARYGLWDELHRLTEAVFDLSGLFAENRLPEVVSGIARDELHPHPGIYPYSCEPQGWSSSMVVQLVQALLGLHPFAPLRLLFVDPHLPPWLPDITLSGVRVGDASVSLQFERTPRGDTRYRLLERTGRVRVVRQPVPSGGAGLGPRAWALLRSLRA